MRRKHDAQALGSVHEWGTRQSREALALVCRCARRRQSVAVLPWTRRKACSSCLAPPKPAADANCLIGSSEWASIRSASRKRRCRSVVATLVAPFDLKTRHRCASETSSSSASRPAVSRGSLNRDASPWREIFNSDVYERWVNPNVVGNGGSVWAEPQMLHGLGHCAQLTLPANSLLVFAR